MRLSLNLHSSISSTVIFTTISRSPHCPVESGLCGLSGQETWEQLGGAVFLSLACSVFHSVRLNLLMLCLGSPHHQI